MIVQCELCSTRFKLDDAKVKEEGVRVRCSKCRHIFVVKKERAEKIEEPDFDALLNGLVSSTPEGINIAGEAGFADLIRVGNQGRDNDSIEAEAAGSEGFDFKDTQEGIPDSTQGDFEPAADQIQIGTDNLESDAMAVGADSDSYGDDYQQSREEVFSQETVSTESGPFFDIPVESAGSDLPISSYQAGDVSTDKVYGSQDVVSSIGSDDFDFSAGISWDVDQNEIAKQNETASLSQEERITDFPIPDTSKDQSSQPVAFSDIAADEIPPPAISSRRLGKSRLPLVVVAISVVSIIILGGGGLYFMLKGPEVFERLGLTAVSRWAGIENKEEGGISIRNTRSEFIRNRDSGELLVIKGEVVNVFKKPRASIQLKATVYDAKGGALTSKSVYCGNSLTQEQLSTLPMTKIDGVMANQFGDSLSNLGVQPGKAIPFVVVFSNIPKESGEFGLEIVGSTTAGR
ncbi:hypothetical protein OR1_04166 [Geobacter sp. OR-1]|uniref:DUF3426 domain-containing protein n=1 Tax=Geobacter sp. OR-1 TaxID=1266765 RepID=UPI000543EEC0|nr:DUF3426 domain-containing protein [Geobacter sp. OR-1]GAM11848.1 hypothetical protein OR1_04166 [Geobacter sp. OR-1]